MILFFFTLISPFGYGYYLFMKITHADTSIIVDVLLITGGTIWGYQNIRFHCLQGPNEAIKVCV